MNEGTAMTKLNHLNEQRQPHMVDVGGKSVTARSATAQAEVVFPPGLLDQLGQDTDAELLTKKGPLFQTAILAGIGAAKRTSELIPLCHPIPMEHCSVTASVTGSDTITVRCTAEATHKTGVEMEALTGVTLAALTLYDMCKALSHEITIRDVRLVAKSGGKRTIHEDG